MLAQSITTINQLPPALRRAVYARLVPSELRAKVGLAADLCDAHGVDLLELRGEPGRPDVQIILRHRADGRDPVLYAHLTDTLHGQIHVLLYIINDPDAPRYDVDVMPDGSPTLFGTERRNLAAEAAALRAGLAPGQIRRGLRVLPGAIRAFEAFVASLEQELFFVEPLYYHNAVLFERYGFAYQQGLRLMRRIDGGFSSSGDLTRRLDGSTPFREQGAHAAIRLRSWALHDGVLGEPFTAVRMYRRLGSPQTVDTAPAIVW